MEWSRPGFGCFLEVLFDFGFDMSNGFDKVSSKASKNQDYYVIMTSSGKKLPSTSIFNMKNAIYQMHFYEKGNKE